jgi:hypothetical protein
MTSEELRNYATVVAALVALLVFALNSFSLVRNRRIENLSRFNQTHQRLFADGSYITRNITALEAGTLERDRGDPEMDARFHLMLLEIERLAILANNKAVPRHTQVYMFGSYAGKLLSLTTEAERESMFWELALGYLEGLARDTERYRGLSRSEREKFWH